MSERYVWIVLYGVWEGDWIAAVYATEALANEHVAKMGGRIEKHAIANELIPDHPG